MVCIEPKRAWVKSTQSREPQSRTEDTMAAKKAKKSSSSKAKLKKVKLDPVKNLSVVRKGWIQ